MGEEPMPGGHEGRGGTQVKFSDAMDWWCGRPQPREDMETVPFIGEVAGETPMSCVLAETRRKDVGPQSYGGRIPVMNGASTDRSGLLQPKQSPVTVEVPTSHGNLRLRSHEPDTGFLPTASVVDFLRSEYVGSRAPPLPQRYFPTAWR